MNHTITKLLTALIFALSASLSFAGGVPATEISKHAVSEKLYDPSRVTWQSLHFTAQKLFVTVNSIVSLHKSDSGDSLLETTSDFLNRKAKTQLWFDGETLAASKRVRLNEGKKPRYKLYNYLPEAVEIERRKPLEGESKLPYEQWGSVRKKSYSVPVNADNKALAVTDSSAVLYALSAANLQKPGDEIRIRVFSDGVFPVLIARVEEVVSYNSAFSLQDGVNDPFKEIRGERQALLVSVDVENKAELGDVEIDVLGLSDDVRVLLDTELNAPVQLTGKADKLGDIKIVLKKISLS